MPKRAKKQRVKNTVTSSISFEIPVKKALDNHPLITKNTRSASWIVNRLLKRWLKTKDNLEE